jgi:hypothetical protein
MRRRKRRFERDHRSWYHRDGEPQRNDRVGTACASAPGRRPCPIDRQHNPATGLSSGCERQGNGRGLSSAREVSNWHLKGEQEEPRHRSRRTAARQIVRGRRDEVPGAALTPNMLPSVYAPDRIAQHTARRRSRASATAVADCPAGLRGKLAACVSDGKPRNRPRSASTAKRRNSPDMCRCRPPAHRPADQERPTHDRHSRGRETSTTRQPNTMRVSATRRNESAISPQAGVVEFATCDSPPPGCRRPRRARPSPPNPKMPRPRPPSAANPRPCRSPRATGARGVTVPFVGFEY